MIFELSPRQIKDLKNKYRQIIDKRQADRIRVVLALADGNSVAHVSRLFLLGEDTVRRYFCLFKEGGINGLLESTL
ncbi:MAG: helix-turn-helix domain containing protein [Planctomycetaceae bacterium]|jgi:hypothetical protein|nr:helix-turn-helix domain containing protein [Planctomycetaceae bacterium]